MMYINDEIKEILIKRKEELLSQPYTQENSHLVERIDILLKLQEGEA